VDSQPASKSDRQTQKKCLRIHFTKTETEEGNEKESNGSDGLSVEGPHTIWTVASDNQQQQQQQQIESDARLPVIAFNYSNLQKSLSPFLKLSLSLSRAEET